MNTEHRQNYNAWLNFYVSLYQSLENKELPTIKYSQNQKNLSKFINLFPLFHIDDTYNFTEQVKLYIYKIIGFINKFKFFNPELQDLATLITEKKLLEIFQIAQKHYLYILIILKPSSELSLPEQKRLYLGILWFLIGYYINFMISRITSMENFPTLQCAGDNKWVLFITCCFIFYDDILDLDELDVEEKKVCLNFTQYFFEFILHQLSQKKELEGNNPLSSQEFKIVWSNIITGYEEKYQIKLVSFPIMKTTSRVLQVCLDAIHISLENDKKVDCTIDLVSSIQDLFMTEVKLSKLQKVNSTREEMLRRMLEKSQKSILVIFKCLLPQYHITDSILSLTFRFSFLSQLLDDLNDRVVDIEEGNNTIFTQTDIEKEIKNTLLYIWDVKEFLEKQNIKPPCQKELLFSNHLSCMLVFNYALGKQISILKKMEYDFNEYFWICPEDILNIRLKKIQYQKKLGNFSFK